MASRTVLKKIRKDGAIIVSTFPERRIFSAVARNLIVDKHLCACINVIKIDSLYHWKGKLEIHEEYLALFKSTRKRVPALIHEIEKIHPYEVPEIVELKTNRFSKAYLSWLDSETSDYPDALQEDNEKNLARNKK